MAAAAPLLLGPPGVDDARGRALDDVLAAARHGAADAREALATRERIGSGDADTWVDEWAAVAGLAWAAASDALARGRLVSARHHLLRAATYYAATLEEVGIGSEPGRARALRRRQGECFARAAALLPAPAQPVGVPYAGTTLPAWFFPAPGADAAERRPLLVVDHGDGPPSRALVHGGAAAAERGYHWLAFDAPGRGTALHERQLRSRPDWEAVLAPVVDAMTRRADVDATRLAVLGLDRGGYGVLRALTSERRFAAAAVEPAVADLLASWIAGLPASARGPAERGDAAGLERELRLAELFAPETVTRLRAAAMPFDRDGTWAGILRSLARHRLHEELRAIETPLLLIDDDQRSGSQARGVAALLRAPHELVRVGATHGTTGDDPLAPSLRDARLFDWLDHQLRAG